MRRAYLLEPDEVGIIQLALENQISGLSSLSNDNPLKARKLKVLEKLYKEGVWVDDSNKCV